MFLHLLLNMRYLEYKILRYSPAEKLAKELAESGERNAKLEAKVKSLEEQLSELQDLIKSKHYKSRQFSAHLYRTLLG